MHNRCSMRKARILLTGFEPFDGASYNISNEVATEINKLDINQFEIETKILTVDEKGSKYVSELIIEKEYDCIIQLGYSNKATTINLETQAKNKIHMRIKDNSERQLKNKKIDIFAKNKLMSTVDIAGLLEKNSSEITLSSDAGSFVCNESYFHTLNTIFRQKLCDRFGRELPCLFIHLPSNDHVPISRQLEIITNIIKQINNKKIIDVVAAIIRNDNGEILVAKRDSNQPHPSKWEFPGGKLEPNELDRDALKREIFEELKLEIEIISKCGEITHLYDEYFVKLKALNCKITANSPPLELIVHEEISWMPIDDLKSLDWLEANLKLVNIIQNQS